MSELSDLVDDVLGRTGGGGLWNTLVELGLAGIGVPEEAGGSGGTVQDLADVAEALGRHGAQVPLAESAVTAWVLATAGHDPVPLGTVAVGDDLDAAVLPAVPWASHASHVLIVGESGWHWPGAPSSGRVTTSPERPWTGCSPARP